MIQIHGMEFTGGEDPSILDWAKGLAEVSAEVRNAFGEVIASTREKVEAVADTIGDLALKAFDKPAA